MGLMTSWERQFIFIEGGNLMAMPKGEIAGNLLLELDSSSLAHAIDTDDRPHVFTVITAKRYNFSHFVLYGQAGTKETLIYFEKKILK